MTVLDPSSSTLCGAFQRSVAEGGDTPALRSSDGSQTISWREYGERVRRLATGLAGLGVGKGDTVALMLTNRPEFNLLDTALMHLGATPFSIYNTSSVDQMSYLLENAANRVLVCEAQFLDKVHEATATSKVEHIVCVDAEMPGTLSLTDVEDKGAEAALFDFEATWRSVRADDVATLIYTSGTTGNPKGVELTHGNLLHAVDATIALTGPVTGGRSISYLPDAHVANRLVGLYLPLRHRVTVTTVRDPKTLLAALADVQPTVFLAVPMLWYKVKAALEASITQEQGLRGRLARWAFAVGQRKASAEVSGASVSVADRVRHAVADRLVLSKVRRKIGMAELTVAVSGAAPITAEALTFILGLGIRVSEGWGMSETAGTITMNPAGGVRIGTVGLPIEDTEVRLADDGELLVRGPGVMRGYRHDPDRTAEVLTDDGWFHTGDVGVFDEDGYVRIVDRKKDIIINSAGKNMSPANIENALVTACPLVGYAVAIGDNRPHVSALVVLDREAATAYAEQRGSDTDPSSLATDEGVLAAVEAGVKAANASLSRVEHIRTWAVLPVFWEPGGEELTPTSKLKRQPIAEKYATDIDALYAK